MPKLADRYPFPAPEGSHWRVPQNYDVTFNWDYDEGRATMMGLYRKGVEMQWNAENRIDWSQELDEENPEQLPEEMLPISGMAEYEAMSAKEKAKVRRHFQGWQISQFMQGEQGALICAAKIVTQVPDVDSKFYASTQVIDEARHVESYKRLLEKFGVAYPMTPPLQELIDQVLRDSRWDMTYLGMQVVIEGLALAAFQQIRDHAQNPLAAAVNAYVMQDESRHVAFGRLALRDYYPTLTQKERDEREEFLLEACYLMRDRFDAVEVWKTLGLDPARCAEHMYDSGFMEMFRSSLFTRIVPIVKDIGLWGDTIRNGYEQMGIIGYAQADVQALQEADDTIAKDFDARRAYVQSVVDRASALEPAE
ncbi:MAG TPA: ferritin-like domain-containing protein [Caulobacteraceae bacterium]|nr:ferritin-like domain-containing protein [Caulobacteraceae bacterium]